MLPGESSRRLTPARRGAGLGQTRSTGVTVAVTSPGSDWDVGAKSTSSTYVVGLGEICSSAEGPRSLKAKNWNAAG